MKLKRKENEAGFVDMLHKTMEKEDDIKHYYSCLSYEKKFYYSSFKTQHCTIAVLHVSPL